MRDGDWLDSGDLAYWGDGELYITGRAKDVIIKARPQSLSARDRGNRRPRGRRSHRMRGGLWRTR